jgi:hypothetical protein
MRVVLRGLIVCTALAFIGSGAFAQIIDDDTKCKTIEKIIYTPSPDKERVKEVLEYIIQTMRALDRLHGLKGKTEIFPKMTEDSRSAMALVVADRCRSYSGLTVADTAIETYETFRAVKASLGLSKPGRKWAHGRITRRYSSASVLGPRQVSRSMIGRAGDEL